jgi:hypothetical protein
MGMNTQHGLEAWMELSDGSEEQKRAIEEAVLEMVTLAHLGIDALCRHLPDQESSIRRVLRHVLTDPECLGGHSCTDSLGISQN